MNKSKLCFQSTTFTEAAIKELTGDAFIFGLQNQNMTHKFIADNTSLEGEKTYENEGISKTNRFINQT